MPEFHISEDEVTRYVLGDLTADEKCDFESHMAQSAELRGLVRDLEEGTAALAIALPQRRPPAEVWTEIEKAIGRENQRGVFVWWSGFWRSGWAVAVLCVAGWLLYAVLINRRGDSQSAKAVPAPRETVAETVPAVPQHVAAVAAPLTNAERKSLQARTLEIYDLRLRIAEMERETNQLARLLDQAHARLGETNRIKFYHLTADSASSRDAGSAELSPALQRAVLLSIGRELGWVPLTPKSRGSNGHATMDGIDFVDLRPEANTGNQPANQPITQPSGQPQTESQMADLSGSAIPAFVSGDKLVVGLDSTAVSANSSVTLTVAGNGGANSDNGGWAVASYSFTMGGNPTMVTVPLSTGAVSDGGGLTLTVSSVSPAGISNSTQFYAPVNP